VGDLWLDGLTELAPEVAEQLSEHKGKLGLRGISSLEQESLDWLYQHDGDVCLSSLRVVSGKLLPRPVGNGSGVISRNVEEWEEEPLQDLVSAASFQAK
jgi:hypothetical protein